MIVGFKFTRPKLSLTKVSNVLKDNNTTTGKIMRVKLPTKLVSVTTTCVLASSVLALNMTSAVATETPETGPKNIIVLIGDGMSYNQIDAASLYEHGKSNYQVAIDYATGEITTIPGEPSQIFQQDDWLHLGMSNYSASGRAEYDPQAAWSSFDWILSGPTDSAAAATALASAVKTLNGVLGLDPEGNKLENVAERAQEIGKATGVVTSVEYSHATPAAWGVHNDSRNDLHGITQEMLDSNLDVIIGAGHPFYGDNGEKLSEPHYDYMSQDQWAHVTSPQSKYTFIEEKVDFEKMAAGEALPEKLFGVAQAGWTLQQGRSGDKKTAIPFAVGLNENVPSLATLSKAALNTLAQDQDGLFLMVEGGAIDWAGHDNQITRNIEETISFVETIETVSEWVEENSSWDETLVVVTSDHETGYLTGPGSDADQLVPITGEQGQLPEFQWNTGSHSNQLVPLYAKGYGSELFESYAVNTDPVRGAYVDNTDVARVAFGLWAENETVVKEDGIDINVDIDKETAGDGELVLTIPAASKGVTLSEGTNRGDRLIYSGQLPEVVVSDSRSTELVGEGGWSASAKAETFKFLDTKAPFGFITIADGKISRENVCEPNATIDPNVATVFYKNNTNWNEHYFHFQIGNESWTSSPGVAMTPACEGYSVIEIPLNGAKTVTGVFNNGQGTWDNNSGQNYALPGTNDITANHLTWTPNLISGKSGVQVGNANTGALDGGRGLNQPSTLAKATGDARLGTTKVSAQLNLEVPLDSAKGAYNSKLTVTVFPID